jgi:hypothetical protein
LVFPKIYTVPGWQDILIPRFHVGGMGNLGGRTSYGYAGALWTLNYDRYFTEVFFGGAVHDGPLLARDSDERSELERDDYLRSRIQWLADAFELPGQYRHKRGGTACRLRVLEFGRLAELAIEQRLGVVCDRCLRSFD